MHAKRFLYVCAGLLCLALAYHLGARSARGEHGGQIVGFTGGSAGGWAEVITTNGDCYQRRIGGGDLFDPGVPAMYMGNSWSGGPTPATQTTWGQVKARYRQGAPATTTPENK